MHRLRAISFDLDNTLWDVWPAIVRAEQEMYAFLSAKYPRVAAKYSIESLRAHREEVTRDEPHMSHDFTYLRKASLKRCAAAVGYDEALAEEAFAVFYRARNSVTLYRDVLPALETLKARYRLYALTNGNADLEVIGLHHYFHGSFAARDAGALKPAPAMFQLMLAHGPFESHEVLHIGDDPVADVQGARNLGMHVVWLNRDGATWSATHGLAPTTHTSLADVVAMLAQYQSENSDS